ncbi:MAG: opacity protein-like surface antigen [Candidatus Midichloriaceae bacterium]|jgi:opacity protein-like surface antigen
MKKILLSTVALTAFAFSASALEAGKMYMKADANYAFMKILGAKFKGFGAGVGIGYALSDDIRGEVNFNFSKPKLKPNSLTTLSLMGDVYYDFNNGSSFTPYVGAGLGVTHSKLSGIKDKIKDKGHIGLGFNGALGVAYEVAKDVQIDLGYKLVGNKMKKADTIFANTVNVGVKFAF